MTIDEVSAVDADANGHARMLITKRDPEGPMPPEDEQTFSADDLVYDEEGNAFLPVDLESDEYEYDDEYDGEEGDGDDEYEYDDGEEYDEAEGDEVSENVLASLSKALGDSDRDQAVAGAYGEIAKLHRRAERAEQVAKAERDLRLTREYVAKAAEYRLPVPAEVLGPVLKRCAESLSKQDCQVLAQCLEAAEGMEFDPYQEIGKAGGGDNADVLTQVNSAAEELFIKGVDAGTGYTREQAVAKVFEMNPQAYDEYLRDNPQLRR
jgi:hypothetical protein